MVKEPLRQVCSGEFEKRRNWRNDTKERCKSYVDGKKCDVEECESELHCIFKLYPPFILKLSGALTIRHRLRDEDYTKIGVPRDFLLAFKSNSFPGVPTLSADSNNGCQRVGNERLERRWIDNLLRNMVYAQTISETASLYFH